MEENKDTIANSPENTQDSRAIQINKTNKTDPIEKPEHNRPAKKKKKFNGHLRINNKKTPRPNMPDITDDITDETPATTRPVYSELFYCVRQKFFSNTAYFFDQLEETLKTIPFEDIKESNLTLFSYAAMYEKTEILSKLSDKYSQHIVAEDFENNIVPFCLNKGEDTLNAVISVFNKHLTINENFMCNLFTRMAKMSYRELNNTILLNWLESHLTDETAKDFWSKTLSEKNISLTNTSIHNSPKLKHYLKQNYSVFEPLIENMGKKIEINRNLQLTDIKKEKTSPIEPTLSSSKIYLSDKEEQMQNFTKEEVTTKVTIKRKKAAA